MDIPSKRFLSTPLMLMRPILFAHTSVVKVVLSEARLQQDTSARLTSILTNIEAQLSDLFESLESISIHRKYQLEEQDQSSSTRKKDTPDMKRLIDDLFTCLRLTAALAHAFKEIFVNASGLDPAAYSYKHFS